MPRVLLSQGPRPWPFFLLHTKPQRSCIMNAAVTNMAVMFGAMQVAKRIPFDENPEYVRYAQLVYVTSQLLCLAVFYYCSICLLYTSPSPRDVEESRMPSSA